MAAAPEIGGTAGVESIDPDELFVDGRPYWDAIAFEVTCSRCEYNLRMLETARCPECGLEFEWWEVIRSRLSQSPFLFEHHWRERPVFSWCETVFRSFDPRRFWRRVSIHERIHLGPLWFMAATSVVLFLIFLHASATLVAWGIRRLEAFATNGVPLSGRPQIWAVECDQLAVLPFTSGLSYLIVPLSFATMLLSSIALLCLLRETLGRCRVRRIQILRVLAYAAPLAAAGTVIAFYTLAAVAGIVGSGGTSIFAFIFPFLYLFAISAPFGAALSIGLDRYLRLPRPWALGFVAAFTGALATAAGGVVLRGML